MNWSFALAQQSAGDIATPIIVQVPFFYRNDIYKIDLKKKIYEDISLPSIQTW